MKAINEFLAGDFFQYRFVSFWVFRNAILMIQDTNGFSME